jgi:hypothetical protein
MVQSPPALRLAFHAVRKNSFADLPMIPLAGVDDLGYRSVMICSPSAVRDGGAGHTKRPAKLAKFESRVESRAWKDSVGPA